MKTVLPYSPKCQRQILQCVVRVSPLFKTLPLSLLPKPKRKVPGNKSKKRMVLREKPAKTAKNTSKNMKFVRLRADLGWTHRRRRRINCRLSTRLFGTFPSTESPRFNSCFYILGAGNVLRSKKQEIEWRRNLSLNPDACSWSLFSRLKQNNVRSF